MANKRLSVIQVSLRARQQGIKNASRLASVAGITLNTAYRWWNDDPSMKRIESDTLLALADVLHCEPGDLLTVEEL